MIDVLHREFIYLWYYFSIQFHQILGYWILGMVIGSAVSVFLKDHIHNAFRQLREKKLGICGIFISSILGIASPLCMYGTIPIAASFSRCGIKDDWLAAFMMSSILLNPQVIIYSVVLGQTALMARIVFCYLCGCVAGLLVRVFYTDKSFFNFVSFKELGSRDTDSNLLLRFLKNLWRNLRATGLYFLLGIVLAAVFQRYVSSDIMTNIFAGNEAWGILMAATIGVPLYACGGGAIPLLQTWMLSGMSIGSVVAFVITGPATKITNIGAVKIVLGVKNFLFYIVYTMGFAFFAGLIVNLLLQ